MEDFTVISDDLKIKLGDFLTGESDFQHVADVIETNKGEWKIDLFVGVGAIRFLSGSAQDLEREIRVQLYRLGYSSSEMQVEKQSDGSFKIYTNARND